MLLRDAPGFDVRASALHSVKSFLEVTSTTSQHRLSIFPVPSLSQPFQLRPSDNKNIHKKRGVHSGHNEQCLALYIADNELYIAA